MDRFTPCLHITVASCQGFIPWAKPHTFFFTNPCHSLLACLTLEPLFLKQFLMVSIHLLCSPPTDQLPTHSCILYHSPSPHGQSTSSSLCTTTPSMHSWLSILPVPSKPLEVNLHSSNSRHLLLP